MEQNTLNQNIWHAASIAGLALGAVSSGYLFLTQWIAGDLSPATLGQSALVMVLSVIKFAACIFLMRLFMTKFALENSDAQRKDIFRMGMRTALLSSLLFSAVMLANILYISSDLYNAAFTAALEQSHPMLDSATRSLALKILPQACFIWNFIYCFIFGTVLSAILSRRISAQGLIEESNSNEQ